MILQVKILFHLHSIIFILKPQKYAYLELLQKDLHSIIFILKLAVCGKDNIIVEFTFYYIYIKTCIDNFCILLLSIYILLYLY